MAKVFYESLAIHFQGTQEKPWQPSSKPTRKIKNLCRSWSDPTQWGKRASHKTRSRSESGANSTSGGHQTRVARRQSLQGVQAGTGQNETRRESAAQRSARPKPTSVGVRCVLHQQAKKPSRLILKQPRLAYYSYMPPGSPEVSALKQLLKPTEDNQWNDFTTARVRCAEAQRAAATAGHDWLDCCTCMCCVKALFYHCTKDDECHEDASADPCSCQGPGAECAGRWGILGVLSLCMPCVLCYPLIQAANRDSQH